MTGIEALNKLKEGKTLRRNYWDNDKKCKAVDFFGDWIVFYEKEKINITDEEFETLINSDKLKLKPLQINELFDFVAAGEFLNDDWEIVNSDLEINWSYCWLCKRNQPVCPKCNTANCSFDCECDVPQWRQKVEEAYNNKIVPEFPTTEEIEDRRKHLMQHSLDQIFISLKQDTEFLQQMENKKANQISKD